MGVGAVDVELHLHTAYSFGQGASLPEEYVIRAAELGYKILAVTDRDSLAGALEFALAAKAWGIRPVTGAELTLRAGGRLLLLAENRTGYANLCRLISLAHRADRRRPALDPADLAGRTDGLVCLTGGHRSDLARLIAAGDRGAARTLIRRYVDLFGIRNVFLEVQNNLAPGDKARNQALAELGEEFGVGLVATGDVHYHVPERGLLQSALIAIHHNLPLDLAGHLCYPNDRFYLRPPAELGAAFADYPQAVKNARDLAERLAEFDLTRDLGYRLPDFQAEGDRPADAVLAEYCRRRLEEVYNRFTDPGLYRRARERLEEELRLIAMHNLAGFFLVYRDIVRLIREVAAEVRGPRAALNPTPVLGRGSSVSSLVCYLIGLSRVDPVAANLFLGRFLNEGLQSLPDIDIDMPREIRERVILRIYERYGPDHAALVAAVSTFRLRGAVRTVGKALGLPAGEVDRLARLSEDGSARAIRAELARRPEYRRRLGEPVWARFAELVEALAGFPRQLGQHIGGMVISSTPLIEMVPIVPAAIPGRFICQWDKDSCEDAGFAKIDFLSLGMLSAVEEAVDLIAENGGPLIDLSRIPFDDPAVYDMLGRADTIGTFQMGSRAQRQLLVQTRPRNLKELADQDALVRPGPGNGGGGRIYAPRKHGLEPVTYDHPKLEPYLAHTYGVMVYQDQAIQAAMAIGGFSPARADALRRALSRRRSEQAIAAFWEEFRRGALAQGIPEATARRVFDKIRGFSAYGYPQSHAVAFAQLAYQTAWLKLYYPAEFLCALLNNYPLGFYAPDVLIKDAQRHGVVVLPPDINLSRARCTLEGGAVRLGLAFVKGIGEAGARTIEDARRDGPFRWLGDLVRRTGLPRQALENLILVGACDGFGLGRRELLWQLGLVLGGRRAGGAWQPALPLDPGPVPRLPEVSTWDRMLADYRVMGLSVAYHPVGLLRPALGEGVVPLGALPGLPDGTRVTAAGLVVARQRPENARGLCFITLHDEFGEADVVILPGLYERRRDVIRTAPLLVVAGRIDRSRGSLTLLAEDVGRLRVPVRIPESAADPPEGRRPLNPTVLRLIEPPGLAALAGVPAAHSFR